MADKPSRSIVLYGDGLARFVGDSNSHIHSLASVANCGFLSLPHAPPESENERVVREFAHLLDASEAYDLAVRLHHSYKTHFLIVFMGLKAALVTDSSALSSFGKLVGLDVLQFSEICEKSDSFPSDPSDATASKLLRLLGFESGKCLDVSLYDSVFVHIGVDDCKDLPNGNSAGVIDSFIGGIMRMDQPGSEILPRLHLSVVLSYGSVTDKDVSAFPVKTLQENVNPVFAGLVPRQSFTMRGVKTRDDVRDYCPMLVAQFQHAVTRKDLVDTFSFESLKKLCGSLVIPADRFIHEVAFKLWKAPKYGA
ncbi:unnamed protein product [Cochlearia groenlandica]